MQDADSHRPTNPIIISPSPDPEEARKEAAEYGRYLLAKSYFDCKEYDRCAAVFLAASGVSRATLSSAGMGSAAAGGIGGKGGSAKSTPKTTPRGKAKAPARGGRGSGLGMGGGRDEEWKGLSQKALFLALYARYIAEERRKDEASEMILGPADKGSAVNKSLQEISAILQEYLTSRGEEIYSSGWLEFLYGVVLAKGKVMDEARRWLLKSVTLWPYNWGAWLELGDLVESVDEVSFLLLDDRLRRLC
jgi:anaphase-promoting complex subunit 8